MSIESETAVRIAHQERAAKILSRTGGEVMHPDHYDFREQFRDAVLAAMDESADVHSMPRVTDGDLPELLRAIDKQAERLWLRRMGLAR